MIFNIPYQLKNKAGIYFIRCTITDEIYIGATLNFRKRFCDHNYEINKRGRCFAFKQHVELHGIDNFIFSILELTVDLKEREVYFIKLLSPKLNVFLTDGNTFVNWKQGLKKGQKRRTKIEMIGYRQSKNKDKAA